MPGLTSGSATSHGFVRSALLLTACVLAVALLLIPFAGRNNGTSGPLGVAGAAAICLASGLIAEGIASSLSRTSPLSGMLIGMMVRMMLPLAVCVAILAAGQTGLQHLPFIGYLLTFYMVTLALETWLGVKRAASCTSNDQKSHR
jgi:hypothetical protein